MVIVEYDCVVDDEKERSYESGKRAALSMAGPQSQSEREATRTLPERQ